MRPTRLWTTLPFAVFLSCAAETAPMQVLSIAPSSGATDGGTAVVLHGEHFAQGAEVFFGGTPGTNVTVVDPQTITAVTPPHAEGIVDVAVENPNGDEDVIPQGYTFVAPAPEDVACFVTITPTFDAVDVDVVASVTVEFSLPIDTAAVQLELRRVGEAATVPVDVVIVSDQKVELHPLSSLAFFEDYSVSSSEAPRLDGLGQCPLQGSVLSTRFPEPEPRPLRPGPAAAVAIIGDTAIVASPTYRGFQVYDVSSPTSPVLINELVTDGTPVSITVDGSRAYAPAGAYGVYVLDVSNPSDPVLAGVAGTPGQALEVIPFTDGTTPYLAVADGTGGLRILDVTQAEGAVDVAALQPSGDPNGQVLGLALDGTTLAVAQHTNGFALLDISIPNLPLVLASRQSESIPDTFFGSRAVNDVALGGGTLFVSLNSFGAQAFDVSDPSSPVYVDHSVGPQGLCSVTCPDVLQSLALVGTELYGASTMTGAARFTFDGVDLSLDASLPAPGRVNGVAPVGPDLWTCTDRGLVLFDAAAPDGASPIYAEADGWGLTQGILARSGHLYVTSSSKGLETYSLADPLKPELLGVTATAGAEADVGLLNILPLDDLLIVADGRAGLSVFDASSPASPTLQGSIVGADGIVSMVAGPTRVYACDGTYDLWSVDVSDPQNPSHVSVGIHPDVGGCYGLALDGNRLFMAGSSGLGVYDISQGDPTLETYAELPADDILLSIAVRGSYLYASTYVRDHEGTYGAAQRIVVFDISNPASPTRVFKGSDLGGVVDVSVRGDKLFVAGRGQGVWIWGLQDPTKPELEGQVDLPGDAYRLAHSEGTGEVLYVSQRGGGVGVIPVGVLPAD